MTATTFLISGLIAIVLAMHTILTMNKRSVWPTIFLILVGCGLLFEAANLAVVAVFMGG